MRIILFLLKFVKYMVIWGFYFWKLYASKLKLEQVIFVSLKIYTWSIKYLITVVLYNIMK